MKKSHYFLFFQQFYLLKKNNSNSKQSGKYDTNKFSQMYDLLATPNMFRNAAGALVQLINNKQIIKSTSS
jgi:hypothetical protein